ncbi:MAG: NUDIX hydrolase [Leptospiraceae bacterium]|nr:NUDIX hydrolase [Leptospiraceae bacterium]
MKYCSACGSAVVRRIPAGDSVERDVCPDCETIHYQNPRVIVGCLPVWQDQILLCKRAIEPRYGYWTLPCGFMENGETTAEGAARETWEEARARVEISHLFALFNVPHINQVHLIYYAPMTDGRFAAGPESLEVALFSPQAIDRRQIAFRSVLFTLQQYTEHGAATPRLFTGEAREPSPDRMI